MEILKYPNKILRYKTKNLHIPTDNISALTTLGKQMYDLMIQNDGLGLAAPQVGINLSMFVTSLDFPTKLIINPQWKPLSSSIKSEYIEGCLSFPGWIAPVKRFDSINANYYTIDGKHINIILKGILSQVFQHESDHCNGVLFIDYLTNRQKNTINSYYK